MHLHLLLCFLVHSSFFNNTETDGLHVSNYAQLSCQRSYHRSGHQDTRPAILSTQRLIREVFGVRGRRGFDRSGPSLCREVVFFPFGAVPAAERKAQRNGHLRAYTRGLHARSHRAKRARRLAKAQHAFHKYAYAKRPARTTGILPAGGSRDTKGANTAP